MLVKAVGMVGMVVGVVVGMIVGVVVGMVVGFFVGMKLVRWNVGVAVGDNEAGDSREVKMFSVFLSTIK